MCEMSFRQIQTNLFVFLLIFFELFDIGTDFEMH